MVSGRGAGEGKRGICFGRVTVKVAQSALQIPLALWERAGVRETVMAAATYIVRGGADAMAVTLGSGQAARVME
jgi:hypothetical protein